MKTKRVNRYYCEFCKKANCSAPSISRHESACTMNPQRVCRVCKMVKEGQPSMLLLLAALPFHKEYRTVESMEGYEYVSYSGDLTIAANEALPNLRELANNCPACILAAIRQAHIPVPMVTDFNFTEEMKDVWADINNANAAEESYG